MTSEQSKPKTKIVARWYFGGLGSAGAACCTHPLDLLKVVLSCHLCLHFGKSCKLYNKYYLFFKKHAPHTYMSYVYRSVNGV